MVQTHGFFMGFHGFSWIIDPHGFSWILIGPHDSLCIQRSSAGDDQILVFIEKSDGDFCRTKDLVFWSVSGVGACFWGYVSVVGA